MSHDIQASWAATELARLFQSNPGDCFHGSPPAGLSVFASREGRTVWPFADGVIVLHDPPTTYRIALEFKRPNEGTHGILTALGQSLAYINKGYNGAIAILPRAYGTHTTPGLYSATVLDTAVGKPNLGVFTYEDPDTTLPSPFMGKLRCERPVEVDSVAPAVSSSFASNTATQWMHVREGSSTPSAFFRFLQVSKLLPAISTPEPVVHIPSGLRDAINRIAATADPLKYLSNSVGDSFRDKAWRNFWFNWVLTQDVMQIWSTSAPSYVLNASPTRLEKFDGVTLMVMFASRSDSIKSKIVNKLNAGTLTEDEAWESFARNIRKRAHSYREDVDSGLEHMAMLDSNGRPTELGYRFIDWCERTNAPHVGVPKKMLGAAMLKNGDLISLLHYTHRFSEELFRLDPLRFATGSKMNRLNRDDYRDWLEDKLANELRVLNKVAARGGTSRKPLQAELTMLRKFNFVSEFRISVGLEINWPVVQDALDFPLS